MSEVKRYRFDSVQAGWVQQEEMVGGECVGAGPYHHGALFVQATDHDEVEAERDALVVALREDHETLSSVVDWPERSHDVPTCPVCALLAKYPQEDKHE